jgi:hypothetical protein
MRKAALVPTFRAATLAWVAPEPRLLAAPSPMAENQRAPRNSTGSLRPARAVAAGGSPSVLSKRAVRWQRASISSSQRSVSTSNNPVPLAIETLQSCGPPSSRYNHSAGDIQRRTRWNNFGSVRRSQRNFAGQYDARNMQPVRPWTARSESSVRKRAASGWQRESAQV